MPLTSSFPCECGKRGKIILSKLSVGVLYRRYECECGKRWSTTERQELPQGSGRLRKDKTELSPELQARFETYLAARLRSLAYAVDQGQL